MARIIVGIDNGTSGAITVLNGDKVVYRKTPIKTEKSYTKKDQNISRIDFKELKKFLQENTAEKSNLECLAVLERPLVNPRKFKTTQSAMRSLEATLICLEELEIPVKYIDSKEWQRHFFPGIEGREKLKKASLDYGNKKYPELQFEEDSDSLLIAEYSELFL
jgi:hypothetical protein